MVAYVDECQGVFEKNLEDLPCAFQLDLRPNGRLILQAKLYQGKESANSDVPTVPSTSGKGELYLLLLHGKHVSGISKSKKRGKITITTL